MNTNIAKIVRPLNSLFSEVSLKQLASRSHARAYTFTSEAKDAAAHQLDYNHDDITYESLHKPSASLPNCNVWSYIMENQEAWSHKPALTSGITGQSYTFAQLKDYSLRFGRLLKKMSGSVPQGEQLTVATLMPNCPEWPVVFFGTVAMGGVLTPINITYNPAEIARHILNSGARVFVVDSDLEHIGNAAMTILKKKGYDIKVVVNGHSYIGDPDVQKVITSTDVDMIDPVMVDPQSPVFLPYSSGTSGNPKGVVISHAAVTNCITTIKHHAFSNIFPAEGNHQDISMGLLPFFHIYGSFAIMLVGMSYGSETITLPRFDPKTFASAMEKHKFSVIHSVPSLLQFLAQSPTITPDHLNHLRTITCGAAPVPTLFAEKLSSKVSRPITFQEVYGMTETICTHITPVENGILGSCGQLLPNVSARICDVETGNDLLPGEEGELLIQAPWLMTGYHNNKEATDSTLDEDGWVHTGDIAKVDDQGYFKIVDRFKELIKVKGVQVSPSEVESHLLAHPNIVDAGVVGVPHDRAGEVPKAFVVSNNPKLTSEEVKQYIESRLSRTKHLVGGVEFVQALPKNAQGKLLRRLLKEMR